MSKKEEFKEFIKKNPKLVKYVRNGEASWQKFYEIYDIYGENEEAWKEYLGVTATVGTIDALSWLKNINLDSVQSGVANIQKMLGMVQELTSKDDKPKDEYKPRPIYKHFED